MPRLARTVFANIPHHITQQGKKRVTSPLFQKNFSNFFGGNQTIVKGRAPQSVLDNASRTPFSDIPNGTAITVPKSGLPAIKPKF